MIFAVFFFSVHHHHIFLITSSKRLEAQIFFFSLSISCVILPTASVPNLLLSFLYEFDLNLEFRHAELLLPYLLKYLCYISNILEAEYVVYTENI